jgi:excisionase family DNA binding protein
MAVVKMLDPKIEKLVDADLAAEYLGFSAVHTRKMAREKRIPAIAFPVGKKSTWRFRISDLEAWVSQQQKAS